MTNLNTMGKATVAKLGQIASGFLMPTHPRWVCSSALARVISYLH